MAIKQIGPGHYTVTGNERRLARALASLVGENEHALPFDKAGAEGLRRKIEVGDFGSQTRIVSIDGEAYVQVEIQKGKGIMWEYPQNDESVKATATRWDDLANPTRKKE